MSQEEVAKKAVEILVLWSSRAGLGNISPRIANILEDPDPNMACDRLDALVADLETLQLNGQL